MLDRATYYVSRRTHEFAEATEGLLQLFFLPSYSPEFNPEELVWKNIKYDHLGRASIKDTIELRCRDRGIKRLREAPELITGSSTDFGWHISADDQSRASISS
ncbi:MAG: transposase [Pseudonocardiaceae bacterium]